MAKDKTDKDEPRNEGAPEEQDTIEDDDLPPLPPLKGKFYTPNPNARPAKLHTTYPY